MPIPKITNTATDEQCDLYDRILEKVDEKNKDEVSDLLFDYCDINTLNGFNGGFKYALALAGVLPSGQGENHDREQKGAASRER